MFSPAFRLTRPPILFVLLPGLLFEAGFNLDWRRLREDAVVIAILATVGVLLTAGLIGALGHVFLGLALPISFLLGAILAATDPVAVVAMFRRLGVPARLATIVEAESLVNDGTGVVLFTIALGIVLSGSFQLIGAVLQVSCARSSDQSVGARNTSSFGAASAAPSRSHLPSALPNRPVLTSPSCERWPTVWSCSRSSSRD